jgi:hypothetical protein
MHGCCCCTHARVYLCAWVGCCARVRVWACAFVGACVLLRLEPACRRRHDVPRRWDGVLWKESLARVLALLRIPDVRTGIVHGTELVGLVTAALMLPLVRRPNFAPLPVCAGEDVAALIPLAAALHRAAYEGRGAVTDVCDAIVRIMKWQCAIGTVAENFAASVLTAPPAPPCASNVAAWGEWARVAGKDWRRCAEFVQAMSSVSAGEGCGGPVISCAGDVPAAVARAGEAPLLGSDGQAPSLAAALEASGIPDVALGAVLLSGDDLKRVVPSVTGSKFKLVLIAVRAWHQLHPTATLEDARAWLLAGGLPHLEAVMEAEVARLTMPKGRSAGQAPGAAAAAGGGGGRGVQPRA